MRAFMAGVAALALIATPGSAQEAAEQPSVEAQIGGGGRPVDLYRRIKSGIGGTIMPAADASLTDDDLWALVHFVLSLSRTGEEASR